MGRNVRELAQTVPAYPPLLSLVSISSCPPLLPAFLILVLPLFPFLFSLSLFSPSSHQGSLCHYSPVAPSSASSYSSSFASLLVVIPLLPLSLSSHVPHVLLRYILSFTLFHCHCISSSALPYSLPISSNIIFALLLFLLLLIFFFTLFVFLESMFLLYFIFSISLLPLSLTHPCIPASQPPPSSYS